MKYKLIGIVACVVLIIISILDYQTLFSIDAQEKRHHQHEEATEKTECNEHDDQELCSHLPLIIIDTGGIEIPGKGIIENGKNAGFTTAPDGSDRITAFMRVVDNKTENNHLFDDADVSSDIVIHARGNSSRFFDKIGYRIKLVENDQNNPQSLLGMDAHHEWALHGPYLDKTFLRNYMWYNIAGECMSYSPNVSYCEVIINGEYQGVYVLMELIGKGDEARLDLDIDVKDNTYTGYLLRLDRYDGNLNDLLNNLTTYTYRKDIHLKLEVEYPGESKLTKEMKESIEKDFSLFEKSLYSYDYNSKKYGYKNYIDVDSFVDYFIINEFTTNYDAGIYSTYMYKDINGKFKMSFWDFNNSCDNYQEYSTIEVQHFEMQNRLWFEMLIKDEEFVERIISRYRELRQTYLSEEYLMNYIDEVSEYLGSAIERNDDKWKDSFTSTTLLTPIDRDIHTYEDAIRQLKTFIQKRGDWMDENIESLRQYCAESSTKNYNEVTK